MTPPFLVLEGLDGAGTTTQVQLLAQKLEEYGASVHPTCEPSTGPIGAMIREMLRMEIAIEEEGQRRPVSRETLALLFAADRLHHLESEIEPALRSGKVVLSDRYYHSSLAYQGDVEKSATGEERVDYGWVQSLNKEARAPTLTVYVRTPVDTCLRRLSTRSNFEIYEREEKLRRLATRYDEVMELLSAAGQEIFTLDGEASREEITAAIWAELQGRQLL